MEPVAAAARRERVMPARPSLVLVQDVFTNYFAPEPSHVGQGLGRAAQRTRGVSSGAGQVVARLAVQSAIDQWPPAGGATGSCVDAENLPDPPGSGVVPGAARPAVCGAPPESPDWSVRGTTTHP